MRRLFYFISNIVICALIFFAHQSNAQNCIIDHNNQKICQSFPRSHMSHDNDQNILRTPLDICGLDPVTGFYRNGYCQTGSHDHGVHVVCARVTDEFLHFSREQGNDLMTPQPAFGFSGLKNGDYWCLCASRWLEAYHAGVAPPINLEATHQKATQIIDKDILLKHGIKD